MPDYAVATLFIWHFFFFMGFVVLQIVFFTPIIVAVTWLMNAIYPKWKRK